MHPAKPLYGIRAPMARLTNVYGGGMSHRDSFVPRPTRAAASGEQRRDLVFVDIARA